MKRIILLMMVVLLVLSGAERMPAKEKTSPLVIVLDPGHDLTHSGAGDNGLREEVLNLKIAQYCMEELLTYDNVEVYMTRYTQSCPHPGKSVANDNLARVEFAESVHADAYISLHLNSASAAAKGVEIFYPNTNYRPALSTVGENLAQSILEELTGLGLCERGVFIRNAETITYEDGSVADYYQVIREAKKRNIPGIIVEHAFISNASDAANFLSTDENLKTLGVADATGIAKYYGLRKGGYENVFDAVFYADKYEDVKKMYGYDAEKLLDHFIESGMKEGRQGIGNFDPYAYRGRYEDLALQYKEQMERYYYHYIEYGKAEGRSGAPVDEEYTVTFLHGEEIISTQTVAFGHGAIKPDTGQEGMYTLFDRQFYCITEDTVIYISYEPIKEPEPAPGTEEDRDTESTETETDSSEGQDHTETEDVEYEETESADTELEETESDDTEFKDTESESTESENSETENAEDGFVQGRETGNSQDLPWLTISILILGCVACIGLIVILFVQLLKSRKDTDLEA